MMRSMLFVTLALCTVAIVLAQHPRHCDAPREFEAHGFQFDPKMQFFRRGHLAYDSREERISLFEEISNATDHEFLHTIHLFREHRAYDFNLQTKVCTAREIHHHFHRIEIPRDAHFVGEAIVGTNAFDNAGVLTTHWEHHNDTLKTFWFGAFTDQSVGCVPVMDNFHDDTIGTMHTQFFDVVLGISDPNVFIPDSSCPRPAKVHANRKH